ncbi:MAG: hypothetical protein ACI358_05755 [Candidatus Limimorpha sp.]
MNGKENNLLSVLESFSGVTEFKDENEKLEKLESKFEEIAKEVICGGCFEINGIRRIYPLEIEFYYHEEGEDGLKDPVMYHTDDHENKKLEYYPLGSLNCHVSGIDVTFENEAKQYRASFLIRKYKVCEYKNEKWEVVEDKECEERSTYIYEDMFMSIPLFDGVNIKWVSSESDNTTKEILRKQRKNVAEYEKDNDGKYKKVEISKEEYDKLSDNEQEEYFSYSEKKLKKCNRMWTYSVVNN